MQASQKNEDNHNRLLRQVQRRIDEGVSAESDRVLEQQVMHALKAAIGSADILVLVTHKAEMLELTDRLMVVANHQVVMDGPKAQVL